LAGEQQAARRVEVDGVGRGQPEGAGLAGEAAGRHPEGAAERAGEGLDGVVAGLEAGLGDGGAAAEAPGGALEEEAAPERRRRLADAGADEAVVVEGAEHRPRRQGPPVEALVEGLQDGVDDVAQAIRGDRLHAAEYAGTPAGAHDRDCCAPGILPAQVTAGAGRGLP
jgi:hypothetical protein